MKVAYIGNFVPPHSTENEVRKAFHANGWAVDAVQEQDFLTAPMLTTPRLLDSDLVLYTMTQGLDVERGDALWTGLRLAGIPSASLHLDLYYGLASPKGDAGIPRDRCPAEHPMFRTDFVFTADGGHQDEFARDGVNHHWLPPAVSADECRLGTPRDEYRADIVFVGSWSEYHQESTHRFQLVQYLLDTYGDRVAFWPKLGEHAVRLDALRDLYASAKVVVGDSCMYGIEPPPRYCSDRVPETLGRGGFLLHPLVEDVIPGLWNPGDHLDAWQAGDWDELEYLIQWWTDPGHDIDRQIVAAQGRAHTMEHHTYTQRVATMLEVMGL